MGARRGNRQNIERSEFAYTVDALYKRAIAFVEDGKCLPPNDLSANADPAAHRVASAFAFMHQMLTRELRCTSNEVAAATGLLEAYNMFFALTDGSAHPVFDYLKGLASEQVLAKPTIKNWWQQGLAVGLYRASGMGLKGSRAVEATFLKVGVRIARSTLNGWHNRFLNEADRLPDAFATELHAKAAATGSSLEEAALQCFAVGATAYPRIP